MTSPLKSLKHQLRGYLELEQLFGSSELSLSGPQKSLVSRNIVAPPAEALAPKKICKLLVLLDDCHLPSEEQELLKKMLNTLGINENLIVVADLVQQSIDDLIAEKQPKTVLSMGNVSKNFGFDDFLTVHSQKYKGLSVLATWSPKHLLLNTGDKKHSWQILLLLKNLI